MKNYRQFMEEITEKKQDLLSKLKEISSSKSAVDVDGVKIDPKEAKEIHDNIKALPQDIQKEFNSMSMKDIMQALE